MVWFSLNLQAQLAPTITSQPTNLTSIVGGTAVFSVTTGGTGPFTYQWQFNDTNLPAGIITVAGSGTGGYSGDGGAASLGELNCPAGVAVDASGNIFIADSGNNRFRKVGTNGVITTVAGNGTIGYSGDGGAATLANLGGPDGVGVGAVDASGNLFIADGDNNVIRRVGTNGIITTVAGDGNSGYSGDGGAATHAELSGPWGVAVDASGNLFIADGGNNVIRKVGTNKIITTVAGNKNGWSGYSGDGGAATSAELNGPYGVAVDAFGNLFIADSWNNVIRKVGTNGIITTVAGNGTPGYSGDGGAATLAELDGLQSLAVDASGNLFIADTYDNVIRKVGTNGIITTVAGNGIGGYSGDGSPATSAELNGPYGVAVDASGNLFIADLYNNRIRKVVFSSPALVLHNVDAVNAGIYDVVVSNPYGSVTSSAATLSVLGVPVINTQPQSKAIVLESNATFTVAVTGAGPLTYQWQFNGTNLPPSIIMVAGNGTGGYSGDGGAATLANLNGPLDVTVDVSGNLFIADEGNSRIRKVGTNGIITTVAGNGTCGYSGDGGAATLANVGGPDGVGMAVDASGNLFIADGDNNVIRKVGTNGIITTVAGDGNLGYSGDGGKATRAELNGPFGVAVDTSGNLFIADGGNNVIRKVGTNGIITTVAGGGYSGDGGAATNAELHNPTGVAVDASGNLFVAGWGDSVIRKVGTNGIITTVVGNGTAGYSGDGGAATNAELNCLQGLAVDASGNLFIADGGNNVIRKVGPNGIITTVAGNGSGGYSGDGGAATLAQLNWPFGVAVDVSGNLFIADVENNVIRKVVFSSQTLVLNSVGAVNAGNMTWWSQILAEASPALSRH